ncbi:MAG: O-acetylhomoserine aminocarboxypropyltransferase [SAR324 cluster bacterium]|nr:O-acetylhomoserine aminocarboxypropyltransferase [SAR324 cluster bacterium]MBL7034583.1 O-acetylhomoserine aminocarboxypropyltransferase [SAR324 cluster bacterium]
MKKLHPDFGFNTLAVHAGTAPDPTTGARSFPIYQTTSYVFDDADHAASLFNLQAPGFIYSRLTNPTVAALEEKLATLEGGRGGTVTSSGHAAETLALFPLMSPGMEVIVANKLYGGTINLMGKSYQKFGWNAIFVDSDNPEAFRKAVSDKTRAIFIESLANPGGVVMDIESIAKVAGEAGVPLIVDNTMATPFLCRPFEWGADIVVHSTTKFLSGQGNAVGGVVVDSGKFLWLGKAKFPSLSTPSPEYNGLTFAETFGDLAYTMYSHAISLRDLGCSQSPMNAWITLNGIETLPLRMERHCSNGLAVAKFLENHSKVEWVSHAGLESSTYHELGKKYMPDGSGSVFTFGVIGGYESGLKMLETVELFSHVANIGDTRSLILHPASTTHRQLTEEQLISAGAGPEVVRLSIGIECAEDLIRDLDQALNQLS